MLVNVYLVIDDDLEIVLVINKIDLLLVEFEKVCKEIEDDIGIDVEDVVLVLVKVGIGIEDLFE